MFLQSLYKKKTYLLVENYENFTPKILLKVEILRLERTNFPIRRKIWTKCFQFLEWLILQQVSWR